MNDLILQIIVCILICSPFSWSMYSITEVFSPWSVGFDASESHEDFLHIAEN